MEPKILVKHTRIEISNYELGDCPKLEYIFSVWDPVTHRSYPKGIEYNADEKRNHHFFFGKQSDEKMMKRYRSV